jgi:Trypsin-like peptidase domain
MKIALQHCNKLSCRAMTRRVVLTVAVLLSLGSVARTIGESIDTGSGFLIESHGYILTNHHVVAGAERIGVMLHDATKHEASIVALDAYRDLALLKIEGSGFPTAAIGSSQKVEVMDHIMALGFPLIESVGTEVSMSDGRINAIRQTSQIPWIQVDVNLNFGNSGGPVVNDKGEVIGIAMAKLIEQSGSDPRINAIIPIDEARHLIEKAYPFGMTQTERDMLSPQEIYAEVKKATVLVIALKRTQPQTQPQTGNVISSSLPPPEPQPESTPSQMPEGFILKEELEANLVSFVEQYLVAGQSGSDPLAELSFYADNVDYFDKGIVSRAFIARDIQNYASRWPWRKFWIGEVQTRINERQQGVAELTFRLKFAVQNSKKTLTGVVANHVSIRFTNGKMEIVAIRATNISRREVLNR